MLFGILFSLFSTANLFAQEWHGWRATIEPRVTQVLGSGDHVADIWRYEYNLIVGTSTILNYGAIYRPVFTKSGSNLNWRFEVSKRAPGSNHSWNLHFSILKSRGTAEGQGFTPKGANYFEACRIFDQSLPPLINDDEPSRLSPVRCGGTNEVRQFEFGASMEQAFFEHSHVGLYGTFGLNLRKFIRNRHDWLRQTAVLHDYFGNGQDFANFVTLDAMSRAPAWLFEPTLGLRVNTHHGRLDLGASLEQSIGIGMLGIDSTIWVDDDNIYQRENQKLVEKMLYLHGEFALAPIHETALVLRSTLTLYATYRLHHNLSMGATASCGQLGTTFKPAQWSVPSKWYVLEGTGWRAGERQNLSVCNLSSRITFIL